MSFKCQRHLARNSCIIAILIFFRAIAPASLLTSQAVATELLMAAGLCVVLTDAFFLNVTTVAFTGEQVREPSNLALTVLKYFVFFPPVATFAAVTPLWIGNSVLRLAIVAACFAAAHFALHAGHRRIVKEYCRYGGTDDEGVLPLDLGLRHRSPSAGPALGA